MIYLDANALIAVASNQGERTQQMHRLLRASKGPFYVSPLADYEARKMLCQLTGDDGEEYLEAISKEFLNRLQGGWDAAILQSLKIARHFKSRLAVDSADTLHVGWALSVGAETFASFDRASGPRALALCHGLKLFPKADAKDFQAMRRLKGSK